MSVTVSQPGTLADRLKNELRDAVRDWEHNRPRSRQTGIGASDLGHPCLRYLAYKATGAPPGTQRGDPWPAIVGTSCHEWVLTQAFENDPRWSLGRSMEIGPGLRGTYDLVRNRADGGVIVIDHKVLGFDSLKTLRLRGAKPQYRVQVHAYGFGVYRQGIDVTHVAIAGWPRSGFLRDLHVWIEPYDSDVVEAAFARWYTLVEAAPALTAAPDLFGQLAMADGPCSWCPWFNPELAQTRPELACPGFEPSSQVIAGGAR